MANNEGAILMANARRIEKSSIWFLQRSGNDCENDDIDKNIFHGAALCELSINNHMFNLR